MYITDKNNINNNNDDNDDDLLICYSVHVLVLKIYKMNLW